MERIDRAALGSPRERRLTEQLLLYWNTKRGQRKYPTREELNPEEIQLLWPKCYLLEVVRDGETVQHKYLYIGEAIEAMFGSKQASASILPLADNLAPQYYMVMESQKPLVQEVTFTNLNNQEVKYRQILLPLGADEAKVDHVLGGLSSNLAPNSNPLPETE